MRFLTEVTVSRHKHRQPKPKTIPDVQIPVLKPPPTFVPRSKQQAAIWRAYGEHDLIFLLGASDTSKTFSSCYCAFREVMNGTKERIVVFRPAVHSDEELGYEPGTREEKLAPWLEPIYECLTKITGRNPALLKGILEGRSLGDTRGMTFENCVIIVTEAQNATPSQMRMILTRMGAGSRVVIEGDASQTDLPKGKSGLMTAIEKCGKLPGVAVLRLVEEPDGTPNCRHPLVRMIAKNWTSNS